MEHSLTWLICSYGLKGFIAFILTLLCVVHLAGAVERYQSKDIGGVIVFLMVLVVNIWTTLFVTGTFFYSPLARWVMPALLR